MNNEVIVRTESEKARLEAEIAPLEGQFKNIVIKTDADFERVDASVRMVKRLSNDANTIFDPTIKNYYTPYVFWRDIKKAITDRLALLEKQGKAALISYTEQKQKEREEAERKARLEAEEKERKEREKLEKKAEKAADKGDFEKADDLRAQAEVVHVPAAPVAVEAPKVAGSSVRYRWTGECVDLKALAKAVAEGRASINLITPNTKAINDQARASQDTFPIDGIKFTKVADYAASTR